MSPILTGVIASGISGHLTPPWSPEGAYDALASFTLSSATASVTFSGIPSGYKHLQIRTLVRGTATNATQNNIELRFNGDSGSNYITHFLSGNGSSASAASAGTGTIIYAGQHSNATAGANIFAPSIIDILDYSNTNKNKTVRSLYGVDLNGSGVINFVSGLWINTSSVTSIFLQTGGPNGNFDTNSSFALYGVK